MLKKIQLEGGWHDALAGEFGREYFHKLRDFVYEEYQKTKVFPEPKNIFSAFNLCPYEKVRVVILGQDPYHGDGQATGLSFAVPSDVALPPSLKNIFKEIHDDLGIVPSTHGDLSRWAKQGVLLLNATLTVRAGLPGSHQKKGWEEFTDAVIKTLNQEKEHLVFILWGNYAKQKGGHIDRRRHCVLEAPHPSPFSAHSGFFGCRHFSKTNQYLKSKGIGEIDWN